MTRKIVRRAKELIEENAKLVADLPEDYREVAKLTWNEAVLKAMQEYNYR
jgi:hypothetical protein